MSTTALHVESAVHSRYSEASKIKVEALCCPIDYDQRFLKSIPPEVIERDYGCGDPSKHLHAGETVLDLGSGTGKICFIAAQVVGPAGRVIGVDMNDDMLAIARRNAPVVARNIGFGNVEFRKGRIQDLALDLERLDESLRDVPLSGAGAFMAAEERARMLRRQHPLVADASVDVVVSNCVLNLVEAPAKRQLFTEIFRVLRPGGRAVISDIVSGRAVPVALQNDPELWSGCISGALIEEAFVGAFVEAGFHGVRILKRDAQPWRVVEGIEFRPVTVEAFKGTAAGDAAACELIYTGPFKEVVDDLGLRLARGQRTAVDAATAQRYARAPYREFVEVAGTDAAASACCAPGRCC
jgi:SAM-dependent methyltransferase